MREATIYLELSITCGRDDAWFLTEVDELPQVDQDTISKRNGIPCRGMGAMGQWCEGCPFCEGYIEEWGEE